MQIPSRIERTELTRPEAHGLVEEPRAHRAREGSRVVWGGASCGGAEGASPNDAASLLVTIAGGLEAVAADPSLLVESLEVRRRDHQAETESARVKNAARDEKRASEARQKAIRAAERTSGFLGLGKVLGKVLKAVVAAAVTAATVVTGGAAAPLAVAGLALVLGAGEIAKGLEKLGIIDKGDVKLLTTALEIAGSLLSMGAGLVGGAASAGAGAATSAAQGAGGAGAAANAANAAKAAADAAKLAAAAEQLKQVADTVRYTSQLLGAANGGTMAVLEHERAGQQVTAERHKVTGEEARADIQDATETLRAIMEAFARVWALLEGVRDAKAEAAGACVRALV